VIANSAATRRVLVERLGVKPDAAVVVYYGIDAAQFARRVPGRAAEVRQELGWPERPTWAFVGALGDERKGFDTLFEAWRTLCKKPSWDANLVAIGGGAEVEVWRARARAEGLAERVQLLGFRSDVHRLLAACDGLVAPTRYEAFGLGVAEALAVGLPAIVSADAGVAELYPSDLGGLLLGEPESASELARKLEAWREAPVERTRLVEALSERVRGRTWDHMAEDIVTLMTERIESHAR
jgi:glycosyltransferase involved in cell wall biosynthesis